MLMLSQRLLEKPVMSLQTGAEIAHTKQTIIDPASLQIIGYYVESKIKKENSLILKTQDVREVSQVGFIIDSIDEILPEDDLMRIKEITKLNFELIGLSVIDEKKQKLGKVVDYGIDPRSFIIHQLHVKQPILKSFHVAELLINRTQIVEINDNEIIVKEASARDAEKSQIPIGSNTDFINPFRNPQAENKELH